MANPEVARGRAAPDAIIAASPHERTPESSRYDPPLVTVSSR